MQQESPAERHLQVCAGFGDVVLAADGKWARPTPCADWDARALLEHVIGFHDVLLLRPLGAKPQRPRGDPQQRWSLTNDALRELLADPRLFDGVVDVPAIGNNPATQIDLRAIVPMLTQDVFVHTWDLARAIERDIALDPELCSFFCARLPADTNALAASGMFAPPIALPAHDDPQSRLLARLGRDPQWSAPDGS